MNARYLILFGIVVVETCLYMMTQFGAQTGEPQVFDALLVRGLAMGFLFVPINTVVLGQFTGAALGQVAGLLNLFRQIGGSIGIALIATLLDRNSQQNYLEVVSHVTLLNPATRQTLAVIQGGMHTKMTEIIGMGSSTEAALRVLYARIQTQVFYLSFTQMMWVIFFIFGMALIPLAMLPVKKKIKGPVDAH